MEGGRNSVLGARRFTAVAGAAVALALLCSPASLAATRTTQPGKTVLVYFVINDQKIAYAIYRTMQGGNTNELTLQRYVVRGDFAKFFVINRGKKPHSFDFYGHKIPTLKPGGKVHFSAALLRRGAFPYASTTDPGKAFRGVFPVY
jgi:hypothetical protein